MRLALITTDPDDLYGWLSSLAAYQSIEYDIIDITRLDWFACITKHNYDLYILRAPGNTNQIKNLFDERVEILSQVLSKPCYPDYTTIKIFENKKYLSYWLMAHGIDCPETTVLYDKKEALAWLQNQQMPLVAKTNIGASGKGVLILKSKSEAISYINKAFSIGIKPYIGPNLRTATLIKKIRNALNKKGLIQKRLKGYKASLSESQKYVIFQKYVPHSFEWRVVRIGDSYFAHKKIVSGVKASGSLKKGYDNPPIKLFDYVKNLTEKCGINSAAIDIFDTSNGYLVNEVQTYFGQSDAYQMKVDGVIGRYRNEAGEWIFESGDYASNQCYDLRLSHALQIHGLS